MKKKTQFQRTIRIRGVLYSQYLALTLAIKGMVAKVKHTHLRVVAGKYYADLLVVY